MLKEGFKQSYKISVDTAAYCAKKARYAFTGNVFHHFSVHIRAQHFRACEKHVRCTAMKNKTLTVHSEQTFHTGRKVTKQFATLAGLPRLLTTAFIEAWAAPIRTINSQRYGWVNAMLGAESDHVACTLHSRKLLCRPVHFQMNADCGVSGPREVS